MNETEVTVAEKTNDLVTEAVQDTKMLSEPDSHGEI